MTRSSCGAQVPGKQSLYGEKERQHGVQVLELCTETSKKSEQAMQSLLRYDHHEIIGLENFI
jgi:hypothetical protein